MNKSRLLGAVCACVLLFSQAAYSVTTIDFDGLAAGTPVTTLSGVTFSSNIVGFDLIATTGFDTTSGANYLGVDDGGSEVFFPGDIITLDFATPVTSLSVNFISSPVTPGGAFEIFTPAGSATSGALPDSTLGDGGEVFSVSFASAVAFSTADLVSADIEFEIYSYNVDDITFTAVPVPPAMLLFASGFLLLGRFSRRRSN